MVTHAANGNAVEDAGVREVAGEIIEARRRDGVGQAGDIGAYRGGAGDDHLKYLGKGRDDAQQDRAN